MENTSKLSPLSNRDIFYYRQRARNRLFEALTSFFASEAERRGISKRDVAECLKRDPASITRWLTSPSNLTSDTSSDLLLSLGAEMDYSVTKFADRPLVNEIHPLIARLTFSSVTDNKHEKKPTKLFQPLTRLQSNVISTEINAQ